MGLLAAPLRGEAAEGERARGDGADVRGPMGEALEHLPSRLVRAGLLERAYSLICSARDGTASTVHAASIRETASFRVSRYGP